MSRQKSSYCEPPACPYRVREARAAQQALARLMRRRAQLADLYQRSRAAWDYERYTGVSDGVIDVVDLCVTLVNPSSSVMLSGALSSVKSAAKLRARNALARLVGLPAPPAPGLGDVLVSGVGLPTGLSAPGGAIKQYLVNRATRQGASHRPH